MITFKKRRSRAWRKRRFRRSLRSSTETATPEEAAEAEGFNQKRFILHLKELMEEHEVNQSKIEYWTGITNQAVSMWLSGKRIPDVESMWRLADLFGCTIDELVVREKPER